MRTELEVIVIGAGQAGLAMGYYLAKLGREFVILDGAPALGQSWRTRWDSLELFTPAQYSSLPGMPFPAPANHYPTKDEVAAYLEAYARALDLPIWLDEPVRSLARDDAGRYIVRSDYASYIAPQVVVATGPFQEPFVPPLAERLSPEVHQIHSSQYRNPAALPEGEVLVVGAGNSGVQIAAELAQSRRTYLSVGERLTRLPERVLGRSLFWWLETLRAMNVSAESAIGLRLRGRELLIGSSLAALARRYGVRLLGRTDSALGTVVQTAEGQRLTPSAIVWATGFRPDFGWISVPVLDDSGYPIQHRGVTPHPGLYFLGLSWMYTRGSGLLGWVGRDAEYLAGRIAQNAPTRPATNLQTDPRSRDRPTTAVPEPRKPTSTILSTMRSVLIRGGWSGSSRRTPRPAGSR